MSGTKSSHAKGGLPQIEFRRIYLLLVSRLWVIALALAAFLGLAAWLIMRSPATFEARAVVQVEQKPQKIIVMEDVTSEDFKSAEILKTIEQSFISRSLFLRVIQSEKLLADPIFVAPRKDGQAWTESALIDVLSNMVESKLRRGTRLIDVTVDHTDPFMAQRLVQALVREFAKSGFDQKMAVSKQATAYLEQEADTLRTKLAASEQTLQAYREQHQAVSLEEKQNIVLEQLKDLNLKVGDAKSTRLKLEAEVAGLKALPERKVQDLLALSSIANAPEVTDVRRQLATKESELAAIEKRYLPKHPKYIEAQSQVSELTAAQERAVNKAADLLTASQEATAQTEQRLEQALVEQKQAALDLNKIAIPYNVLAREVDSNRTMLEAVLKRVNETQVEQQAEKNPIRVIEAPEIPSLPQKSGVKKILAIAIVLGTGAGLGLVLLLDTLDSSLRTVDEAEQALGLPSLAVIPESKSLKLEKALVIESAPDSAAAEAFRSLRTSLSLVAGDMDHRSFLFTSAVPAEGKSHCAMNCAAAFAQQGVKTLLIDADLRRPSLDKVFGVEEGMPGFSDSLDDGVDPATFALPTKVDNLFLLCTGRRAKKPAELLAGTRFQNLIETALKTYDRVVIDSAPINAVSDTLLLVKRVHSVVLVVRGHKTPSRAVLRACHLLQRAGVAAAGFVLSRVPAGRGSDYYYYFYGKEYTNAGVYDSPGK